MLEISNEKIISGSADKTIKIWEIESGKCLNTLKGHNDEVFDIIQITNEKIASCSNNGHIKIWNFNDGECIKTIKTGISIYLLYKLSEQIILCSSDYKLKLWNIETEILVTIILK